MKRSDLKAIIKECLIEILAEGIQVAPVSVMKTESVSRVPRQVQQPRQPSMRRNPLDEPVSAGRMIPNPNVKQSVKQAVSIMTDDPLMASIFADTIKTVHAQNAEGHDRATQPGMSGISPHADAAARAMANAMPDKIFEGSDRWASLAFMEGPPRNSPAES